MYCNKLKVLVTSSEIQSYDLRHWNGLWQNYWDQVATFLFLCKQKKVGSSETTSNIVRCPLSLNHCSHSFWSNKQRKAEKGEVVAQQNYPSKLLPANS